MKFEGDSFQLLTAKYCYQAEHTTKLAGREIKPDSWKISIKRIVPRDEQSEAVITLPGNYSMTRVMQVIQGFENIEL